MLLFLNGFSQNIRSGTDKHEAMNIYDLNKLISKTINIGFTLDAPNEGDWGHILNENEFADIKQAGFTAIRLPIQWVAHIGNTPPYRLDDKFLVRVDWAIQKALKHGLAIILDNHKDDSLMSDPERYKERFLSLWKQLSIHYQHYPPEVFFEIMAEPFGALNHSWNSYYKKRLLVLSVKQILNGLLSSDRPFTTVRKI